jgi:hypothetical protein
MAYQDRLRAATRRNETLFKSLKAEVQGLGKKVLGDMIAASLAEAMRNGTKHDSSRAAANWDVQVGGANPYGRSTTELAPKEYHDTEYQIGGRGSGGSEKGGAIAEKLHRYGCDSTSNPERMIQGGWLWSALKIGESGNIQAHLFNPVTQYGPYGDNAIKGLEELRRSVAKKAKTGADLAAFRATKEIAKKLRFPETYKK